MRPLLHRALDLPANLEAEQELIGAMLLDCERAWPLIRGQIGEADFLDARHARIFAAAATLAERGEVANGVTLKSAFERDQALEEVGGPVYLARLAASATTIRNVGDYARHLRDLAGRRRLIETAERMIARASNVDLDTSATLIAGDAMEEVRSIGLSDDPFAFRTGREIAIEEVESWGAPAGLDSTGFPKFDVALGGGLQPGTCVGVVARMKVGKSVFLGSVSANLARAAVPHAYIWLEMSDRQIVRRQMAFSLGLSGKALLHARHRADDALRARAAEQAVQWSQAQIMPKRALMELDQIRDAIALAKHKFGIKGAMIDYLQLIRGQRHGQSRVEHLENVAQTLAEIAKRENVWILSAAQENAQEGVRWGDGMLMAFDQVFRLHRDPDGAGELPTLAALTVMVTRDTPRIDVGSIDAAGVVQSPGLIFDGRGPMFVEPEPEII